MNNVHKWRDTMKIRSVLAALCITLAAAPAIAGPSGQHSGQASAHGSAASGHSSAAVASGAATVLAVPVIVFGAGIAITGSALAAVGEGAMTAGSQMIEVQKPHRVKRWLIVPDGAPTLD